MEATLTAAVADTEVVAMVAVAAAMVMAAEVAMVRVMEATTGKFFSFFFLSFFIIPHHLPLLLLLLNSACVLSHPHEVYLFLSNEQSGLTIFP